MSSTSVVAVVQRDIEGQKGKDSEMVVVQSTIRFLAKKAAAADIAFGHY